MPYIIDEIVVFDEIKGSLKNKSTCDEIAIPPAAAGILLALLSNKTRPVEREEVINQVFLLLGFDLSANTLTQYVSLLRKNLKKIGIENDVILTIPKVGFYISEERCINYVRAELEVPKKRKFLFSEKLVRAIFFYGLVIFFILVVSLELVWAITSKVIHPKEYSLTESGKIDKCSLYVSYNLKQVKRQAFVNKATELAHRFLPCSPGDFYIFDINAMSLLNKDGKLYLARCSSLNDASKPVVCAEVAIRE
ncbi:TPA: transcriptional regulator [Enterobacter cancerogenus]